MGSQFGNKPILDDLAALAHHSDSRTRVYPQVAGATIILVSDGVADTFGSWIPIVPINIIDFEYEVVGLAIYAVDAASNYFIQLGYSIVDGSDPTEAQILGEREVRIVGTPIANSTELLDFQAGSCPANAKLWGRLKTDHGDTDEASIAVTFTRHEALSDEISLLTAWPYAS